MSQKESRTRKKGHSKIGETQDDCENREQKRLNNFDPRHKLQRTMTSDRLSYLLQEVSKSNPCGVLLNSVKGMTIHSFHSRNLTVSGNANEIISSKSNQTLNEKITMLLNKMSFNQKEVKLVEKVTRSQQDSQECVEHPKGRLIASNYHSYHTKINTTIKSKASVRPKTTNLAASMLYHEENISQYESVKWKIANEIEALRNFMQWKQQNIDFKLKKCRLFLD